MNLQKIIGSNIRKYRIAAGISQEELAARMNVDQAYISRLVAGQKNITIVTLQLIAESLKVDVKILCDKQK